MKVLMAWDYLVAHPKYNKLITSTLHTDSSSYQIDVHIVKDNKPLYLLHIGLSSSMMPNSNTHKATRDSSWLRILIQFYTMLLV